MGKRSEEATNEKVGRDHGGKKIRSRLDAGIADGWTTDASRVYGAVRWYHRAVVGANPALAELYAPIIRK